MNIIKKYMRNVKDLVFGDIAVFIAAKGTEYAEESQTFQYLSGESGPIRAALRARSILKMLVVSSR